MRKRVFSGIRPSGKLHIGNYLGAIKQWIELQERYDCIYGLVDYHAITTPFSPEGLKGEVRDAALDLLAAGVDPKRSLLIVQSHVPEHTELAWILGTLTPVAWLERVPTYKEKAQMHPEYTNLGLLSYPVLMAADILIYKAEAVPVGEDQLPHLELTREIARRFNSMFGPTFPEPDALLSEGARIMSLSEPTKKMSKTGDEGIALSDSPADIKRKIRRAVTDSAPHMDHRSNNPGVQNLWQLYKLFAMPEDVEALESKLDEKKTGYQEFKSMLAEKITEGLAGFRERRSALERNPAHVARVLAEGGEKARALAQRTLSDVKQKMGLI